MFEAAMPNSPAAEYAAARGLGPDTVRDHRLGWVASATPGFERFVGRLAIPNICASGHVVGLKFRALTDGVEPKYDGPSLPARLFNLRALNIASATIALTEGEVDAISLTQLVIPTVGIPGGKAWKRHHFRLFEGYDRVVLIQDDDPTGNDLAKSLIATDLPVVTMLPPDGFPDVNAALVGGAGEALAAAIRGEE